MPNDARHSTSTLLSSVLAVLLGTVGIVALGVVLADDDDSGSGADVAAGGGSSVSLSEFAIEPADLVAGTGGSLSVTNGGSIEHNLAVEGEDVRTANLAAGDTGELDLGDLPAGDYSVLCEIPGHADAGMRGTLTIGDDVATGGQSGGRWRRRGP